MTDTGSDFRDPRLRQDDFLGAFGVVESAKGILMVQNRRRIHGQEVLTWDLPGGQVEPGEALVAGLRRELLEEASIKVVGAAPFLFVQEGTRRAAGQVAYAWRSFFFSVQEFTGTPAASSEVLDVRWVPREEMSSVLGAPYHDSFATWLSDGGRFFTSTWDEA